MSATSAAITRDVSLPRTYRDLLSRVAAAATGGESIVVQAGHFLLFPDEASGIPLACIQTDAPDPRHGRILHDSGHFPFLTWRLGLNLLAALPAAHKRIMVVVNDWQYVANHQQRDRFYSTHSHLPPTYRAELALHEGSITLLSPQATVTEPPSPFFSEARLRNHYRKAVKRLLKQNNLPPEAAILREGDTVSCHLPDATGAKQEFYCSNLAPDCAGETAQIIHEAATATGCDVFINLVPSVCGNFVNRGTELAEKLFSPDIRSYVNIGLPAAEIYDEAALIADCQCTTYRK